MDLNRLRFCAKYPFTPEARKFIAELNFDFEKIPEENIEFAYNSILSLLAKQPTALKEIENSKESFLQKMLVSYPLSNILVNLSKSPALKMQYARAKSNQVMQYIFFDTKENISSVANDLFKINNKKISFQDYLNCLPFGDSWKLVYQELKNGEINVNDDMLINLISEKVYNSILATSVKDLKFPKLLMFYASELNKKQLSSDFPQNFGSVDTSAFPPCMRKIIMELQVLPNVGHMSRFVLATFLVNIGMKDDEIVNIFSKQQNFKESLVRYHIANIKGEHSNSTKYSVPSCAKMDSYNTCYRDDTCKWRHPLSYYKHTKTRMEKKK